MRPSATRPTSFWRGESGPLLGLRDAPILIAISSQGFLMRSRMRVFFSGRQIYALSADLLCERVAALVAKAARRRDGVEAAAKSSSILTACECIFTGFGCRAKISETSPRVWFFSLLRVTRGVYIVPWDP